MTTQPPHAESPSYEELNAEHVALKAQIAALRKEHDRLHASGGTQAEHQQHIQKLRAKIKELEEHVGKLKRLRIPGR